MARIGEMVEELKSTLAAFDYSEHAKGTIGKVDFLGVFSTPRGSSKRLVCAVARLPQDVGEGEAPARFAARVRKALAERYAPGFPWPKRLGTYTVLLGDREQCDRLKGRESQLIDNNGLHVNVLLGTVVVDVETFRAGSDTTWGLIDTGEQFHRIQEAVDSWCRRHRGTPRLHPTIGRALSVA